MVPTHASAKSTPFTCRNLQLKPGTKEASLKDVVQIKIGNPDKAAHAVDGNHCLTVSFKLGGGIGLKFDIKLIETYGMRSCEPFGRTTTTTA